MEKKDLLVDILEDDKDIARLIELALKSQGYRTESFALPSAFLAAYQKERPALLLLDLNLPEMKGEEVLKKIRNEYQDADTQILIVSAKTLLEDKIEGLSLGADDYIEKPFDLLELITRVNAKARRILGEEQIRFGDFLLLPARRELLENGEPVKLTYTEYEILTYLIQHKKEVAGREGILSALWGGDGHYESRVLDVHIKDLRKKLHDKDGKLIETVYGLGYRWNG